MVRGCGVGETCAWAVGMVAVVAVVVVVVVAVVVAGDGVFAFAGHYVRACVTVCCR